MTLHIEYNPNEDSTGYIFVDPGFPVGAWNRISGAVLGIQSDCKLSTREIRLEWTTILSVAREIAALRQQYRFHISYSEPARHQLNAYRKEVQSVQNIGSNDAVLDASAIQERLREAGFSRRSLTPEQLRDTSVLMSLRNGANFSVPGSGKTTVAIAVHILTLIKEPDARLLIVAPKNAFGAWDEAVSDCLDSSVSTSWSIVRLVGGRENIVEILSNSPTKMIISYDQMVRVRDLLNRFIARYLTHMILDESHRIKSGGRSQRGDSLLRMAHLPVRRDILSGTPIPNSLEDICPQLDFLWPGQRVGWSAIQSADPSQLIKPFYVRTTKAELHLPKVSREFIQVEMSPSQMALYSMIRKEILSQKAQINARNSLRAARRSVMRLLQVSSNPILVVPQMIESIGDSSHFQDATLDAIFTDIIAEVDSPKIVRACDLARKLVNQGMKCVIWTSFTQNVERIATLLSDLGAVFIHGGVDTGSTADSQTREGRIRMFHDDASGCRVLVANPAACSEGISLHKVCHHAIYVDRTFNAAHYLQSVDRIHRLGISPQEETIVYVLESIAPSVVGAIDYSVRRRLITKLQTMFQALHDQDLRQLRLDEEEEEAPLDNDITVEDLCDVLEELTGQRAPPEIEE